MDKSKTCCFTGHRALGKNFSLDRLYNTVIKLITDYGVDTFIAGGALGFDTVASEAVLRAKEQGYRVALHIYVPCLNQAQRWREADRVRYESILKRADYVDINSRPYYDGCMRERNYKMVDNSSFCLCYFNGKPSGTGQTVKYAVSKGLKVGNLYNE